MRRLLPPLVLLLLLVPVTAAEARRGPCVPGKSRPTCTVWTAKVVFVHDGDTLEVDIDGDGSRRTRRIRMTGVNAPELTRYASDPRRRRGECHSLEAIARTEGIVRRGRRRVRLAARNPASRSGHRLRRSVAVRSGGGWRDVGTTLVREGRALWLPHPVEYHYNRAYSTLAQRAAAAGKGIYDPDACGAGPEVRLRVWVNWDAEGNDADNLNDEWIRIKNLEPRPIPLGGWWVRDSDLRRYVLPGSAVVPAGGTITVRAGSGSGGGSDFFWGLPGPPFENVTHDAKALGDGAYLYDPQGDLRAFMLYPCRERCTDPLLGAIALEASPRRNEYIDVRNVTSAPIDLEGYRMQTTFHGYHFGGDSMLAPGETMRIETQGNPRDDTRLERHWGFDETILRDGGDAVKLVTYTNITIACDAWGSGRC